MLYVGTVIDDDCGGGDVGRGPPAGGRPAGGVLMMIAAVVMLYVGTNLDAHVGIKAARSTPLGGHGGRHAGERPGPCGGPALATRH